MLYWLLNESLEDLANLPEPDDLRSAFGQLEELGEDSEK